MTAAPPPRFRHRRPRPGRKLPDRLRSSPKVWMRRRPQRLPQRRRPPRATSKTLTMTVDGKPVGQAPPQVADAAPPQTAPAPAPAPAPEPPAAASPLHTRVQDGNEITESSESGVVRIKDPNNVVTL